MKTRGLTQWICLSTPSRWFGAQADTGLFRSGKEPFTYSWRPKWPALELPLGLEIDARYAIDLHAWYDMPGTYVPYGGTRTGEVTGTPHFEVPCRVFSLVLCVTPYWPCVAYTCAARCRARAGRRLVLSGRTAGRDNVLRQVCGRGRVLDGHGAALQMHETHRPGHGPGQSTICLRASAYTRRCWFTSLSVAVGGMGCLDILKFARAGIRVEAC